MISVEPLNQLSQLKRMAKDPAFLFYSQDFIVGVQTMSWEDRGKYITILAQMHQQGRLDEETICFLVGSVSVKLKAKLLIDDKGLWYNARHEAKTEKRNSFTESRRKNGLNGGRPKKQKPSDKPNTNHKPIHMDTHMGNEDVNESENEILNEYDNWTKMIVEGNDQHFEQMFMNEHIPTSGNIQHWILDHRDLLNRYPNMRPPNQGAFRKSCIKHIRENYKKQINGTARKNGIDVKSEIESIYSRNQ